MDELSSAGQALAESEWDNFEQAWENLRDTVDSLDQDTTFAEAREQLSSSGEDLTGAWDDFISKSTADRGLGTGPRGRHERA